MKAQDLTKPRNFKFPWTKLIGLLSWCYYIHRPYFLSPVGLATVGLLLSQLPGGGHSNGCKAHTSKGCRHSMRTQSQKMRGHWVRSQILVQNLGALGENVTFDLSVRTLKQEFEKKKKKKKNSENGKNDQFVDEIN